MCTACAYDRASPLRRSSLRNSRRFGFTLVEIMIVVALLEILAGLSVPRALSALSRATWKSAQTQITILSSAIEFYRLDVRSYPPNLEAILVAPGATTPYELICLGADNTAGDDGENRDVHLWR